MSESLDNVPVTLDPFAEGVANFVISLVPQTFAPSQKPLVNDLIRAAVRLGFAYGKDLLAKK